MKKFIAILAVLMLVPFTAFGLESLSEDVMDNVTGQAGVSIATDITIDVTMDTMAWGDKDGLDADTSDTEGWIGLKNFKMNDLRIRLDKSLINPAAGSPDIRLFTIDVATGTKNGVADTTYVRLGLGSQHITMTNMSADVELGKDHSLGKELGDFAITNFDMVLDGKNSYVDIYAHDGAGVTLDLNITIKSIDIAGMAWGDSDGLGAGLIMNPKAPAADAAPLQAADTTSKGYVGLKDMHIRNMTITGQVMIDVATLDPGKIGAAGVNAGLMGVYAGMLARGGYDGGTTGVLIRLNDLKIGMASFEADCVLAADAQLAGGTGNNVLGSIWMDNVNVTVNGWVGIFAH